MLKLKDARRVDTLARSIEPFKGEDIAINKLIHDVFIDVVSVECPKEHIVKSIFELRRVCNIPSASRQKLLHFLDQKRL